MKEETKSAVIEYDAKDGQRIVLTFDLIRRYLVQGHPEFVTVQEFMYFMGVCQSQGMNPYKRDCYLIKYTQGDSAAIITAIDFLRSRAKAQPDCKGWKAGIILQVNGNVEYREGTFLLDNEKLVGGWFQGKPAGWDEPIRWTVPLKTYIKRKKDGSITRFWQADNQPGQIAKVAECQGLKKCWPQEFQNLYTDAEIAPDDGVRGLPEIPEQTGKEVDAEFDADAHEEFDKTIGQLKALNLDHLNEYVTFAARVSDKTVYELKQEAIQQFDNFLASFQKWEAKKYPGEQKPDSSDKDPIREEYIRLKTAGFSTWVHKNLDAIRNMEQQYRVEIKAKWMMLYPQDTYPLDKQENAATGQDALSVGDSEDETEGEEPGEEDQGLPPPSPEDEKVLSLVTGSHADVANRACVPCPDGNGRSRLAKHCKEECPSRMGYPTWSEYDNQ